MTDRSRLTTLAALALGVLGSAALPAHAQPGPGGGPGERPDRRPPAGQPQRRPQQRPPQRPPQQPPRRPPARPPVNRAPAPFPPPPFVKGRRLPPEYLGYNYRIEQWQRYHLPRPRPGYYWVQYGADFVLVSPAGIGIQIFIP